MADINDSDGARVVSGYIKYPRHGPLSGTAGEYLGSPKRSGEGEMHYNTKKLDEDQREYIKYDLGEKLLNDKGKAVSLAVKFGLPKKITGTPLGCGCRVAYLAGATKPVNSHIEADYMCDAGWHNYVRFELIGFENKSEGEIKIDANGNLIETTGIEARELGNY